MATIIDTFSRPNSDNLGFGWTDCNDLNPGSFEPLGIYDGGVVVSNPIARTGVTYDTGWPTSGHPPTGGRAYYGIGAAARETGSTAVNVKCRWTGNWFYIEPETTPPSRHVEASPLVHVNPASSKYAIGAWTAAIDDLTPLLLVGYLGSPPELFEVVATAAFPNPQPYPTDGVQRDIEIRTTGTTYTVWVDGTQISLSNGYGLGGVPVPLELQGSTVHGFALDAHLVQPLTNVPTLKGIESVTIQGVNPAMANNGNINDLKWKYFGGGADVEYDFYSAASTGGLVATDAHRGRTLAVASPTTSADFTIPVAKSQAGAGRIPELTTPDFVLPLNGATISMGNVVVANVDASGATYQFRYSKDAGANWYPCTADSSEASWNAFQVTNPQQVVSRIPAAGVTGGGVLTAGDTVRVALFISHPSDNLGKLYILPNSGSSPFIQVIAA